eukprot:SAG11_NODE_1357_length_5120_cov_2.888668_3_plen_254_part_00
MAGEELPRISAHIVADWEPERSKLHGSAPADLNLTVMTQSGKLLHQQSWPSLDLTVPAGEIGRVIDLPSPVSPFELSPGLAGEVAIFSLTLVSKNLDGSVRLRAPPQVYTFGILKPGTSVHAKVDEYLPMRPLLHAPPALCAVEVSATLGAHNATIKNHGTVPCLYMRLELRSSSKSADEPQFHAAEFEDNFITLMPGEERSIGFFGLPCETVATAKPCRAPTAGCRCGDGAADTLYYSAWNVARSCVPLPRH